MKFLFIIMIGIWAIGAFLSCPFLDVAPEYHTFGYLLMAITVILALASIFWTLVSDLI